MDFRANTHRFLQSRAHSSVTYRPDIDGLRAVAVMIVVLFHAWPNWLKGGFIGVDIFFVISGFLITSIILKELESGTFTVRQFYVRRIRRIFPALITVVLLTLAFGWYVLLKNEFEQLGKHILGAATFVSNFVLWNEAGYFDNDHTTKPLLHLWSLGVEEQFYLVWPLTLALLYKRNRIFVLLAITLAASFLYGLYATYNSPVAAYFSPVTRFWELAAGGILAYLNAKGRAALPWGALVSAVGLLLLVLGAVFIDGQSPFPGAWALLPVGGTCALIAAGNGNWINKHLLGNRLMVYLGLVSYPFYLWHWPLLSFGYIVLGERPPVETKVMLVAASFLLASLTFHLIERPIQRSPHQGRAIKSLLATMVCFAVVGTFVAGGQLRERIDTDGTTNVYLGALNDVGFPDPAMKPFRYGGSLFQQITGTGTGKTLLIGDSVMEQYAPLVAQGLGDNRFNRSAIIFATAGGCPPIPGATRLPIIRFPTCSQTVTDAWKLAAAPEIDTVVIAAAWNGYFTPAQHEVEIQGQQFPSPRAQELAQQAMRDAIGQLVKQGKRVYLVQQPPSGNLFDPRSMISGSRFDRIVARSHLDPMRLEEFRQYHKDPRDRVFALARATGAVLVDPADSLCGNGTCPVLNPAGEPIYTDSVHMRPYFVRSAVHYLDEALSSPKHMTAGALLPDHRL